MTLWARESANEGEQWLTRIRIVAPSGEELGDNRTMIDLRESRRMRARAVFATLPVEGPGVLGIVVEQARDEDGTEWHTEVRIPLEIAIEDAEAGENCAEEG